MVSSPLWLAASATLCAAGRWRATPAQSPCGSPHVRATPLRMMSEQNGIDAGGAALKEDEEVSAPLPAHKQLPKRIVSHEKALGRVLLVYTGGTLGMIKQDGSWAPQHQRGALGELVGAMIEFHDESMPDIDLVEYDPLLDSSNIGPKDWCSLANLIGRHYFDYDGFVVIHGTDTMAYTASALSFMLEGLGKTVVLTGSMIPMREPFNDARRNLISSIMLASQLELCEVAIFFNDRLLRGCRAVKCDAGGLAAFSSPNFPPLAVVGASGVSAQNRHLWRPPPVCRLRVHSNLDARVTVIRLSPGFDDSAIAAMIEHAPQMAGLVLSLYGTGNGPSHKEEFMKAIERAVKKDIAVIAVTQCYIGAVRLETYQVGRRLLELGVVSAGDMTTEACVTKLAYLSGRGLRGSALADAMGANLRGEIGSSEPLPLSPQAKWSAIQLDRNLRL